MTLFKIIPIAILAFLIMSIESKAADAKKSKTGRKPASIACENINLSGTYINYSLMQDRGSNYTQTFVKNPDNANKYVLLTSGSAITKKISLVTVQTFCSVVSDDPQSRGAATFNILDASDAGDLILIGKADDSENNITGYLKRVQP
jgi:hypothetical protein